MPSGKQDAITVSFSEKNKDVSKLLQDYKNNIGKAFIQNDYICEAIRFYEKNKDKSFGTLDEEKVKQLIDARFEEFKKELIGKELSLDLKEEKEKFDNKVLEKDLNIEASYLEDD